MLEAPCDRIEKCEEWLWLWTVASGRTWIGQLSCKLKVLLGLGERVAALCQVEHYFNEETNWLRSIGGNNKVPQHTQQATGTGKWPRYSPPGSANYNPICAQTTPCSHTEINFLGPLEVLMLGEIKYCIGTRTYDHSDRENLLTNRIRVGDFQTANVWKSFSLWQFCSHSCSELIMNGHNMGHN